MTSATKEGQMKQAAIVMSVLAVGWLAVELALKPFLSKGQAASDKPEPTAANNEPAAAKEVASSDAQAGSIDEAAQAGSIIDESAQASSIDETAQAGSIIEEAAQAGSTDEAAQAGGAVNVDASSSSSS